jgi:hypothetical protein
MNQHPDRWLFLFAAVDIFRVDRFLRCDTCPAVEKLDNPAGNRSG